MQRIRFRVRREGVFQWIESETDGSWDSEAVLHGPTLYEQGMAMGLLRPSDEVFRAMLVTEPDDRCSGSQSA